MAPSEPPVLPAAKPRHGNHFDAWNSSSTGHQHAENKLGGSIVWRESNSMKLSYQFKSGNTGGKRISDTVGAGSEDWDENVKALIPKDVKARAKFKVTDMLVSQSLGPPQNTRRCESAFTACDVQHKASAERPAHAGIFRGLVVYINGSTYPLISDHKLKHLLAEHGALLSIKLGRRKVTHVILGRPCGSEKAKGGSSNPTRGAGGGLAATKIQREIQRIGGCGVKYVGVEWVLDSVKNGTRMPETPYSVLQVAAKGQQSVYNMFKKDKFQENQAEI